MAEKRKYWSVVLYPENMVDDWQDSIGDRLQVPYCYAIHDQDVDSESGQRKVHVHLILAFSNTTTYNNACSVLSSLNKEGCKAFNTVKPVFKIRSMYEYLIHNTEDCRKKKKFQYTPDDRICGNLFDIGLFEQVSVEDKKIILRELADLIVNNCYTNFSDFYIEVLSRNDDFIYFDVATSYSGFLERLCKGNYLQQYGHHFVE